MLSCIKFNMNILFKNTNYLYVLSGLLVVSSILSYISVHSVTEMESLDVNSIYWLRNYHMINYLTVFIYLIPLLCTFGFTLSYYKEEGFHNVLLLRSKGRKTYILSKVIVLILSNMMLWFLFYFLNYIICFIALQGKEAVFYFDPFIVGNNALSIARAYLFPSLGLNHSFLNNLLYMLILTAYATLISLCIFAVSLHIHNKFIVALSGFIVSLLFPMIFGLLDIQLSIYYPQNIFHPQPSMFMGANTSLIISGIAFLVAMMGIATYLITMYVRKIA